MLSRQVKSRIKANQKKRLLHLWLSQDKRGIPLSDQKQLAVLIHRTTRRTVNQAVNYILGYDPGHPDGDKTSFRRFIVDALKLDPEDHFAPDVWSGRAAAKDALKHWKETIHGANWEVVDDTSPTEWINPGKYNPHHVTAEQMSVYTRDPNYVPPTEPVEPFDAEAERQRIFDRLEYRTDAELKNQSKNQSE